MPSIHHKQTSRLGDLTSTPSRQPTLLRAKDVCVHGLATWVARLGGALPHHRHRASLTKTSVVVCPLTLRKPPPSREVPPTQPDSKTNPAPPSTCITTPQAEASQRRTCNNKDQPTTQEASSTHTATTAHRRERSRRKEEEGVLASVEREPKHTEHSTVHNIIRPYTYMHAWHTTVQAGRAAEQDRQTDRQTADSKTRHTGGVSVWGGVWESCLPVGRSA